MSYTGDSFMISTHTLQGKYVLTAGVIEIFKEVAGIIFDLNSQIDTDESEVLNMKELFIEKTVNRWVKRL